MPTKLHPSTVHTVRVAFPIDLALSKLKGKGKGASKKAAIAPVPEPVVPPQTEVVHPVMEAPCAPVAAPPLAGLLFPNGL